MLQNRAHSAHFFHPQGIPFRRLLPLTSWIPPWPSPCHAPGADFCPKKWTNLKVLQCMSGDVFQEDLAFSHANIRLKYFSPAPALLFGLLHAILGVLLGSSSRSLLLTPQARALQAVLGLKLLQLLQVLVDQTKAAAASTYTKEADFAR